RLVGLPTTDLGWGGGWRCAARPRCPSCPVARNNRYIVDSLATYWPWSARRGTICDGGRCPYASLFINDRMRWRSRSLKRLGGVWMRAGRRSPSLAVCFQRCRVRRLKPISWQAREARAPQATASSTSDISVWRCEREVICPRPPTAPGTLFAAPIALPLQTRPSLCDSVRVAGRPSLSSVYGPQRRRPAAWSACRTRPSRLEAGEQISRAHDTRH